MDKRSIITIKSLQEGGENGEDAIELITSGTYCENGGSKFIRYDESELTGLEGVLTEIEVSDERRVTVRRTGSVRYEMIFEEGNRHICHYDYGGGSFLVCIGDTTVTDSLGWGGGNLTLDYSVEIESRIVSRNRFSIDVREAFV